MMMTIDIPYIESPSDFPSIDSALADPNGLLGYGLTLTTDLLYGAYYRGIFPWFNHGEPVYWWSPDPRAAFYPNQFEPSRSL
jgi:leucyl/phenylalanyl-tRNA--protein transferase